MVLSYCFTSMHQILMLLADTSRNFFEILSITATTAVQSHSTFLGTFLRFTTWLLAPPSALFRYLFVEMRIFLQGVLDAESFKSAYSIIFETKFLPYASCVLISSSILCMFFVLRNVSIPYPPNIAEEKGSKRTENIEVYKFPPVSGVSKSSLLTSRADRSIREDLKKFVTVKVTYHTFSLDQMYLRSSTTFHHLSYEHTEGTPSSYFILDHFNLSIYYTLVFSWT